MQTVGIVLIILGGIIVLASVIGLIKPGVVNLKTQKEALSPLAVGMFLMIGGIGLYSQMIALTG